MFFFFPSKQLTNTLTTLQCINRSFEKSNLRLYLDSTFEQGIAFPFKIGQHRV